MGQARAHTASREGKDTGRAPRSAAAGEDKHTGQARALAEDAGHGAGKGQGHGKDAGASSSARERAQGHEQGAKAGGIGAHGPGQGAVSGPAHGQGHMQGRGKDTGVGRTSKGAGDRGRYPRYGPEGKGEGLRPIQVLGAGRGTRGNGGKGDVGPRGQAGWGAGARGDGLGVGRGTRSRAPRQLDVQPVRCIPPGIQQMPAHHAHHHNHHHAHLYNIDLDAGDLVPPPPPNPPTSGPPIPTAAPPGAPLPRHESRGRSWRGWPLPWRREVWRGAGATCAEASGGAGTGGREGPERLGPGLGRDSGPPGGRGPPPWVGGVWVAAHSHISDHQGVEEPALRFRAPPERRGGQRPRRTTKESSGS